MTKARKQYRCECCGYEIPKASDYSLVSGGPWDGISEEAWSMKVHNLCCYFMETVGAWDEGIADPSEDFENAFELLFEVNYPKWYEDHPKENFGTPFEEEVKIIKGEKSERDEYIQLKLDGEYSGFIQQFRNHFQTFKELPPSFGHENLLEAQK